MQNIYLFLLNLFFIIQIPVFSQEIRINEFMSSNAVTVQDDDGDFSDWIELFNTGNQSVQLEGWGLSDNKTNLFKWVFPEYTIAPGEYLLIWASGKNRRFKKGEQVNGILREVYSNIPGTSLQDLIKHSNYPDKPSSQQIIKDKFEAPLNVADNYGQQMHGLIKAPATGNFIFWISSDDHGQLYISTDRDPSNLKMIAEVPGWTQSREWGKYSQQKSEPVYLEEGKFYYIKAMMKEGGGGDNLAVRWQWPDGKIEEPVSAEHLHYEGNLPLHTNFSIDAEGEPIILTDKNGKIVDEILPLKLPVDISYGRSPDAAPDFKYFSTPTPGSENNTSGFSEFLEPPVFSHRGGFYNETFQLSITSTQPGVSIVYSLDGSEPSSGNLNPKTYSYRNQYRQKPGSTAGPMLTRSYRSYNFSEPLHIYNRSSEQNQISLISTTFDSNPWYLPATPVEKAVVVKARAEKDGALASEIVTHTYFVNENGQNHFSLPVISIATQENFLFDYKDGINVAGEDFENWRTANPNAEANGGSNANYKRNDMQWEYRASFEYFEEDGRNVLNQEIGLRIHGGWSRASALKSMRIHARNIYGKSTLDHPFFKDQDYNSYKRIILRNSGNDYWYTWFRDAAMQEMVRHMDFDTQAYQPSIVFLNGEYYGILNIRERFDKHYVARKYNLDGEKVDMLDGNNGIETGDPSHYVETLDYIRQNGLQAGEHYKYINTRISVESYIDFMVAETYLANTDWPGNNVKYWRHKIPQYDPSAGPGKDGRWRWMMYDTDFGFGLYDNNGYAKDMLVFATGTGNAWPNPAWSTFLFRSLLENEDFRISFITRYSDQLNTAFQPEVVKPVVERMKKGIEPEMAQHFERWKAPADDYNWNRKINVMHTFADNRPAYVWEHLQSFFQLEDKFNLTVNVSDANHGHVIVNTIPLKKGTRGVNENPWPWQGEYFKKLPLRLEAVPAKGYEFLRWEGNTVVHHEHVLEVNPESDQVFTAIFEKAAKKDELIHYWNFNATNNLLHPTYTLITAKLEPMILSGVSSEITFDTGQGFTATNARFGNEAGTHLRVNHPLGVSLTLDIPTTGFSKIKVNYETRRSGQGAGKQIIEYSVNGTQFIKFSEVTVEDKDPSLILLDLSSIENTNNNPNLKLRITFEQSGGGIEGNNRFDNITVEGIPDDGVNLPPEVLILPEDLNMIEGEENYTIMLHEMFSDPDDDPLQFTASSSFPQVVNATVEDGRLGLSLLQRGATTVKLTASDGKNPPIELEFNVMVYPEAFKLGEGNFNFTSWSADAPEMTFPENMLFLQSAKNDPAITDLLEHPYYIPANDYADEDAANVGFPYRNTRRTRLNGLGENGISFINTGRGRDLGGVLTAISTEGLDEVQARWLAGTILKNSRQYGITVQYRIGLEGQFIDIPQTGYIANNDGHTTNIGPLSLPSQLLNQPYVQLLWRYHYLSGNSGARAELRLDDILLAASPPAPDITHPLLTTAVTQAFDIIWTNTPRTDSYELQIADNAGFANPIVSVTGINENEYNQGPLATGKTYYFRVRSDNAGIKGKWSEVLVINSTSTGIDIPDIAKDHFLFYPNPFRESATIQLYLSEPGKTDISIYDLSGRKILQVYQGVLPEGEHTMEINQQEISPGTYLLILRTAKETFRSKIIKN
jgi:hypothetical protein